LQIFVHFCSLPVAVAVVVTVIVVVMIFVAIVAVVLLVVVVVLVVVVAVIVILIVPTAAAMVQNIFISSYKEQWTYKGVKLWGSRLFVRNASMSYRRIIMM
jgi:cell division protein FtsW (lipid II flippase)